MFFLFSKIKNPSTFINRFPNLILICFDFKLHIYPIPLSISINRSSRDISPHTRKTRDYRKHWYFFKYIFNACSSIYFSSWSRTIFFLSREKHSFHIHQKNFFPLHLVADMFFMQFSGYSCISIDYIFIYI